FTIAGGGILCEYASPTISGNVIYGANTGVRLYQSSSVVTNNTIVANSTGIFCSGATKPTLSNNIVAFNFYGIQKSADCQPLLSHNDVYGNVKFDYGSNTSHPTDLSIDPQFASFEYGNLHIRPSSPCQDAGDTAAPGIPTVDMDGQQRIYGSKVDIGADESYNEPYPQPYPIRTVYVDADANPGGDGTGWETAYQSIQSAVDQALIQGGADIWVAGGTYAETVRLRPFTYAYGGFAGTETSIDRRQPSVYRTSIDAGPPVPLTSTHAVVCPDMSSIDGFSISSADYGISCSGRSVVSDNIVTGCRNTGISVSDGSSTISHNTISGNGLYGIQSWSNSATITGNLISEHTSYGIYCTGSDHISDNIVYHNQVGIRCSGSSSSPSLVNNTIAGNTYSGISCDYSPAYIANNVVAGNPTGVLVSGDSYLPTLSHNDVYGNSTANYSGIAAGVGDISADPCFVDAPNSNYHVSGASPCINMGCDEASNLPLFDIDGEGRVCGGTVDIGADEFWPNELDIASAKHAFDGAVIHGTDSIVTTVFPDFFYVESGNRACGIRVDKPAHGLAVDNKVDIGGVLTTNSDGERCIAADRATPAGIGNVAPMFVSGRSLYSGAFGLQEGLWSWRPQKQPNGTWVSTFLQEEGLSSIGLLVKVAGKITQKDASKSYLYIDDGSGLRDGTKTNGEDNVGIRIVSDSDYESGQWVTVVGVCSCFRGNDGKLRRQLRIDNLVRIQPVEFQ
ncbi:MAG: right-handed parallel beta-helix repeat-containing protein, partial [Armatimonadota bacterium]